jgi:3-oxoadipate enol-lactonase
LAKADLTTRINSITVPVLVIAGAQDPVTTVVDGQFMQEQIPESELFVIEASHISNVEKPQQFNQALADFLVS